MANAVVDNAGTAGTLAVVAAVAGRSIRVKGYVLYAGGTTNATWESGTTALTGPFPLKDQGGAAAAIAPSAQGIEEFWFETAPGAPLNLVTDANVQVSGHVAYSLSGKAS